MGPESSLEELANRIYSSAKVINLYNSQTSHPAKSLAATEPTNLLPEGAPQHIRSAKQDLQEAALRISQLATDPSEFLGQHAVQFQQLACLRWLCHFNIPSLIPLDTSIPYATVAQKAKVPETQLKSIARMAMTGIFLSEPTPGELGHNSTSAAFITNPTLMDWALFMTEHSAPTTTKIVEATEKYGTTESKTETAYNVSKGTDLPYFDWLKRDKEATRQFAGYMKNVTSTDATSIKHLVTGFDWGSLGETTVVDVGGSSGHASLALAESFPRLSFIVQDLPDTLATSKPSTLPAFAADRLTYQPYDFFTPQPLPSVDVFLLRMIIHDWPFAEAVSILKNLVPSLKKPNGRIILMDTVLPRPGSVPATQEAQLRVRDLSMMQTFNSKEREMEDWIGLLRAVDPGLRLKNVVQPFGSSMSVLEIVKGGEGDLEALNGVSGAGLRNGTAEVNGH
ncbi:hypothetical protein ACLMJK_005226 [Lecanora helva]